VQIVTDSTADLPLQTARTLGVTVVPLYVHFGEDTFRDSVDISADQFYQKLTGDKVFPRTSQPSPADFEAVYREAVQKGPILSLHLSSKVSGTYNSAILARETLLKEDPEARIEVIDTRSISMGLGNLVMEAAQKARAGVALEDVAAWARSTAERTRVMFLLDTLEYLARGGRIGRAQAFLGGLLSVKPLLEFKEGEVHPLERVRTRAKALERLTQTAIESGPAERVITAGSTDVASARTIAERLRTTFSLSQVPVFRIGPTLGVYAGPGCVGIAIVKKDES
jgi:DegV family protein with EDD domain